MLTLYDDGMIENALQLMLAGCVRAHSVMHAFSGIFSCYVKIFVSITTYNLFHDRAIQHYNVHILMTDCSLHSSWNLEHLHIIVQDVEASI